MQKSICTIKDKNNKEFYSLEKSIESLVSSIDEKEIYLEQIRDLLNS